MYLAIRILSTESDDVDQVTPVTFGPKTHAWKARILADVPVYVKHGPTGVEAEDTDFYLNEFDEITISLGVGEEVSVLGTDTGIVWVSEIVFSA